MIETHPEIRNAVERSPLIDTHEHLIEESVRVRGVPEGWYFPCNDLFYLLWNYTVDDLVSAGMALKEKDKLFRPDVPLEEKWKIFEPAWKRMKNTGYAQAVRLSIQELYGEDDITSENYGRINDKMLKRVRKGYYSEIIHDLSNIESCQVQSLQDTMFMESEYPTLLFQDIDITPMSTRLNVERLSQESGLLVGSLNECHLAIDAIFEKYGKKAVAVKNYGAYDRRLNYQFAPPEIAALLFGRYLELGKLSQQDDEALQNHLLYYCVQRATELKLPVKLHTGYHSGTGTMSLTMLRQNASDLRPLLSYFPDTKFVLMHIGYPYQDEFVALAKHYSNVYLDMCWAWIISPLASVRFLKEFLLTAPASKVFTFGGDYAMVELVYGHSRMARRGITQALSELVGEEWLSLVDALDIIPQIMRGNAYEAFRIADKTKRNSDTLVDSD